MSCGWIKDTAFVHCGSSGERTDFSSMLIDGYLVFRRRAVKCLQSLLVDFSFYIVSFWFCFLV